MHSGAGGFLVHDQPRLRKGLPHITHPFAAADILLVPLGASFLEFDRTGRFFDMLYSTFASIEEGENSVRRQQGLSEMTFEWDAVRAIVTRFDGSQQTDLANVIRLISVTS